MSYHIALKLPSGSTYYSYDSDKKWIYGENINDWIHSFLKPYESMIAYNDDEPDDERGANLHSRGAHAKGVVAWDQKNILWMIHSIPNYPEFKDDKEKNDENKDEKNDEKNDEKENKENRLRILDIDQSQLIYGQSVVILTFPYSEQQLNSIYEQLDVMNPHIYYNYNGRVISKKKEIKLINLITIAEGVQHISKHEKWGKDIFEHLSTEFDAVVLCETWCKPAAPSTNRVKNVKTVRWTENLSYSSTNDHSKYAVSMDENKPYVFIGDINHMESQTRRGGGGIIIKNKGLWKAFHSILQNYNDVVENPYFNDLSSSTSPTTSTTTTTASSCTSFFSCFGFCK
jgi:deoxyribonuclease-2